MINSFKSYVPRVSKNSKFFSFYFMFWKFLSEAIKRCMSLCFPNLYFWNLLKICADLVNLGSELFLIILISFVSQSDELDSAYFSISDLLAYRARSISMPSVYTLPITPPPFMPLTTPSTTTYS